MNFETIIHESLTGYKIQGVLGKGGMATVYKARQISLDRMVALKVIHQNLIHDAEFISRFHQEAKLSASLNHPNIVTVHDIGQAGSVHYMAMELLEGRDLHQCIRQQGKISIYATVEIGKAMSKALDYAGKQGVIHRDVKSSNVFLHKDGRIILMDFGIAKAITDSGLTQIGEVMGTPEFMSPEQAQGRPLDARSDLYSLGVVLYECLAGRVPFTDQNKMAIVHSVIYDAVPSPKIYNPDVPAWLENVVIKLLSKDPAKRFASGKELFQALDYRPVATGNPAQATGDPGEIRKQPAYIPKPETNLQPSKGSAQRVALYSLLGVAFVALLVVGYLLWSGESGGGGGIDNGSAKQQAGTEKLQENLTGNNQEAEQSARKKEVGVKKRLAKEEDSRRKTQTGSGRFTDSRDAQIYPTVKIGNQVWMAKNLNYATKSGSWTTASTECTGTATFRTIVSRSGASRTISQCGGGKEGVGGIAVNLMI
jgi:serine/threonine protein kinase